MRLILVRHGQSPSNITRAVDTTVPGPPLTALGVAQAAAVPDALAGQRVDLIYASSMTRAQMTAEPLAAQRELPVLVRDGLREITAGDLEMATDPASIETYLATAFAWSAGDLALRMPGGENGVEAFARFDAVVAEAAAGTEGAAVLVSHGAMIRTWVAGRTDNIDANFSATHVLENTGIVIVDGDPAAGWHTVSWTGAVLPDHTEGAAGGPIAGRGSAGR